MTLKMKTLQSFEMLTTTNWMTQCHKTEHRTHRSSTIWLWNITHQGTVTCALNLKDMILICFKNYLYTVTLMIIHNSLCLSHKLTNTLYALESNKILYLQVAPGKMNMFKIAWKWLFEVSDLLRYGTVSLADWDQWSHLHGSKWSRTLWAFWHLEVRPLHWCKMSGTIYPEKWCHNSDTDLNYITAKA